jgi:predicted nucleotidyltransferase
MNTAKKIGLTTEQLELLQQAFKAFDNIDQVKIFGSRAKGNFSAQSDIDLAIYGTNINRHDIGELLLNIDDSNLPFLVDVQLYHDIKNHRLLDHINRIGVTIYKNNNEG